MPTDGSASTEDGVLVCSLIRGLALPQLIPPETYTIVRFPFGSGESYDRWGMHQITQPDGYVIDSANWDADPRSGLIWPTTSGWGQLYAMIQWEDGDYTELRDQFARDPLGINSPIDTTATDHRPPSPGMQCWTKGHGLFVHPDTPLALRVSHNAAQSRRIVLAEFKLAIHKAA